MYKKITPAAAAVLATGLLFSGAADAAPKDKQNPGQTEKETGKHNKPAENKGQQQQLKSVDKQLDKIEEKILNYKEKIAGLEEEAGSEPEVPEEEPVNEAPEEPEEVPVEEPVVEASEEAPVSTLAGASEVPEENDVIPSPVDESEEPAGETLPEEEIDDVPTDEEIEEEAAEVDEQLNENPGYAGKFHALQNRLNAIDKRLDNLEAKGVDIAEQRDRSDALKATVEEVLASLTAVQDKVNDEVEADDGAVEKEAETEDALKEWNVKFSGTLDLETLSQLDIVVLDDEQNLIETTLSYDPATSTVAVTPGQPYQTSETYTLYIGKDLAGTDGEALKNSVKMTFTVGVSPPQQ